MNRTVKYIIIFLVIAVLLIGLSYAGYIIYHQALGEIKKRVGAGVARGIGKALDPFSWFARPH